MVLTKMTSLVSRLSSLVLIFLATFLFAEPIKPDPYNLPKAQDSVYKTPWGIDPAPRETDAGRWVLPLRGLLQRTYDISGQKSEWLLGTSILGAPELEADFLGMGSIQTRYPSKLAGLFTTRLGYDATTLGLNGENGILTEERKGVPVDTPVTDLNWERPAFGGNALRLDFRRLVTDSVSLEFGLASHSDVDSKEYSYQNVTHSPYFALGRDSSQIPFGGRNIAMNSMHIQPILTWKFGFGKAFAKLNYINLRNADNTNHKVLLDTLDKAIRTFQTDPYVTEIHTFGYGGGAEFYPTRKLTLSADLQYTEHEIELDSLARIYKDSHIYTDTAGIEHSDSLFYDTLRTTSYQSMLGNFGIAYHTIFNPAIKFKYEFLNTDNTGDNDTTHTYYQDREVGYLELKDTLWNKLLFRTQTGLQRNSSVRDSVDYAPAYSADLLAFLPYHLRASAGWRHDNKFPDVGQLKIDETGRLAFARKDLKYEERDRYTFNLGYQQREVFYGLGLRYENVDNLIKPRWVKHGSVDSTDAIDDVYTWTNIDNVNSLDWILQVGFRLGNWKFYLERGETLDRGFGRQ